MSIPIRLAILALLAGAVPAHATTLFSDTFKGVPTVMPDGTTQLYVDQTKWSTETRNSDLWEAQGKGQLVAADGYSGYYSGNGELEAYLSPFSAFWPADFPIADRCNPFLYQSDGLHIRSSPLSSAQISALMELHLVPGAENIGMPYLTFCSGILTTWSQPSITGSYKSPVTTQPFQPTPGHPVVIRALVKTGTSRGTWPAIWLQPASPQISWPPEIDLAEIMPWGAHTQQFHTGFIYNGGSQSNWYKLPNNGTWAVNMPHKLALIWDVAYIEIHVDNVTIVHWDTSTLPGLTAPMYLIVNQAVGGDWPCNELGIVARGTWDTQTLTTCATSIASTLPAASDSRGLDDFVIEKLTVDDSLTVNGW